MRHLFKVCDRAPMRLIAGPKIYQNFARADAIAHLFLAVHGLDSYGAASLESTLL
jgi:hypothetical protein